MIHTLLPTPIRLCAPRRKANATNATNPPTTMIMKRLLLLMLALSATTFLSGCGNRTDETPNGTSQKRLHLAFVANSPGEYWSVVNLGCSIAAQQLGAVDVDFRYPATPTIEAQQQIVNDLLAAGVDGIAISPIDAEKQTEFLNQIAAKTLLFCADSDASKSKRVSYIGTDNVAAGRQAAELIKEALPAGGKIALFVGYAQAQNTMDRIEGIRAGLAGANIEIVATLEDGQKSTVAGQNTRAALAKHSDLAGVVGISGYHGTELLLAVRDAGQVGKVKIVCFDDNSDTLAGIVSGEIHGTIAQKPFHIGKQTVVHLSQSLRSNQSPVVGTNLFIESRALTKTNVEHYIAQQRNISFYLKDKNP
jgi:ribose transport system substrate-binding protein